MVYCGKPSKGCKTCRVRKIRCDQIKPACKQCTRLGKECPGYRNMLDLAFRDETDSVLEKVKAKARTNSVRPKKTLSATVQSTTDWLTNMDSSIIPQTSISTASLDFSIAWPKLLYFPRPNDNQHGLPRVSFSTYSMFPTVEELGINFFLDNFVLSAQGPSHGYFSYVPELYSNGGMDNMLKSSIVSAGLAGQANILKSPEMMALARREYATALQKINKALRSLSEAVKDTTLLSILMLAIFESIAGGKTLSLKAWNEHVNGAATLVKLRGPAQLRTPVGFGLFIHATSHLMISCLQREIPMPKQIIDLRIQAMDNVPLDPGWQFLKLTDQITIFRSEISNGTAGGYREIISKALDLDTKLADIFAEAPLNWLYETVYSNEESDFVFDGSYHIYYDHVSGSGCNWIAQLWNAMRATRIMMNEIISGQLLSGFAATPPIFTIADFSTQFHSSTNNIIQLRDDILRSVPQHLGYVNRKPFQPVEALSAFSTSVYPELDDIASINNLPSSLDNIDFSTIPANKNTPSFSFTNLLNTRPPTLQHNPFHPSIGGYFLLWPLFVSGITRASTPAIRAFASRILCHIGDEMGIRQGTNLGTFMMAIPVTGDDGLKDIKRLRDQRPIGPLKEMLRRDERERRERMGREMEALG